MQASEWRPYERGTLKGFFNLLLDSGLEIQSMTYHTKDGNSWVSFPAKPYETEDGSTKYQSILRIPDEKRWRAFQKLAQEAVENIRRNGQEEEGGEVPF